MSQSTASVEFKSAVVSVTYRDGKFEVSVQSKLQAADEFRKKGTLSPVVNELSDAIRDSCASRKG
jgi:hypothetical protein